MRIRNFLQSEDGAVTVDWVVLTGSVVGLGLLSAGPVRVGVAELGNTIQQTLSGGSVGRLYDFLGNSFELVSASFENGDTSGWNVGRISYTEALGHFLGPFAGSEAPIEYAVRLPSDTTRAVIEFDLLTLDSWDGWRADNLNNDVHLGGRGDGVAFQINGQEVHFSAFTSNSTQNPTGSFELNGTTYDVNIVHQRAGYFTDSTISSNPENWRDGVWRVQVVADNPPPQGFNFGLKATTNQHVRDESMGLDNFSVRAFRD